MVPCSLREIKHEVLLHIAITFKISAPTSSKSFGRMDDKGYEVSGIIEINLDDGSMEDVMVNVADLAENQQSVSSPLIVILAGSFEPR